MYKLINVDGIQTYLLQRDKLEQLYKDTSQPAKFRQRVAWYVEHISEIDCVTGVKLHPAVLCNEKYQIWVSAYCLEYGHTYYHVRYKHWWLCRDCGAECGPVLLPLAMAEPDIYVGLKRPEIPALFQHISCPECGHWLQGYLISLNCN